MSEGETTDCAVSGRPVTTPLCPLCDLWSPPTSAQIGRIGGLSEVVGKFGGMVLSAAAIYGLEGAAGLLVQA